MRKPLWGLLLVVGALNCGCSSWKTPSFTEPWSAWKQSWSQDASTIPHQMVVVWSDGVYKHGNQPAVRGFGGRIYFYDRQQHVIPVAGTLSVYGFDDSRREFAGVRPDRRFVFKPEQLQQRYSETALGPSYSVWLPWDKIGGEHKKITLIPIFNSADGQLVRGDQTLNVLPGSRPATLPRDRDNQQREDDVLTASHQQPAVTDSTVTRRRPTTTIFVPETTSKKMRAISQAHADAQRQIGTQPPGAESKPVSPSSAERNDHSTLPTNPNWDGPKWNPPGQRSTRYERLKSRVLRERAERLDRGRSHAQQFHVEQPSPAPSSPSPGSASESAGYSPSASRSGR